MQVLKGRDRKMRCFCSCSSNKISSPIMQESLFFYVINSPFGVKTTTLCFLYPSQFLYSSCFSLLCNPEYMYSCLQNNTHCNNVFSMSFQRFTTYPNTWFYMFSGNFFFRNSSSIISSSFIIILQFLLSAHVYHDA